jgi:hypothetical protein
VGGSSKALTAEHAEFAEKIIFNFNLGGLCDLRG